MAETAPKFTMKQRAEALLTGTKRLRFFRGAMYDGDADEYLRQLHSFLSDFIAGSQMVDEQANDDGLWFVPVTITEDYLQRALRRLHAAIEGKSPEECAMEVLASAQKG